MNDSKKPTLWTQVLDTVLPFLLIIALLDLVGSCTKYMDDVASQDSTETK